VPAEDPLEVSEITFTDFHQLVVDGGQDGENIFLFHLQRKFDAFSFGEGGQGTFQHFAFLREQGFLGQGIPPEFPDCRNQFLGECGSFSAR